MQQVIEEYIKENYEDEIYTIRVLTGSEGHDDRSAFCKSSKKFYSCRINTIAFINNDNNVEKRIDAFWYYKMDAGKGIYADIVKDFSIYEIQYKCRKYNKDVYGQVILSIREVYDEKLEALRKEFIRPPKLFVDGVEFVYCDKNYTGVYTFENKKVNVRLCLYDETTTAEYINCWKSVASEFKDKYKKALSMCVEYVKNVIRNKTKIPNTMREEEIESMLLKNEINIDIGGSFFMFRFLVEDFFDISCIKYYISLVDDEEDVSSQR